MNPQTPKSKLTISSQIQSMKYALKGIALFFKSEHHAWMHAVAAIVVITMGFMFGITNSEWIWLVFAIGFVFVAEMLNTAIEYTIDLVSPEFNPKAGAVKDVAAGAVTLAALTALVIGALVFVPHFIKFFAV
jgi:diacylglycerol kinase